MQRSRLVPDRLYREQHSGSYFVSPDGEGVYWYDNMKEVDEAYGPKAFTKVYHIDYLEDW